MEKLIPAKPSQQELQVGANQRKGFREQVMADKKLLDDSQPLFTQLRILPQSTAAKQIIEKELAWLNANIEVTAQQIQTRKTSYTEQLQDAITKIGDAAVQNISSIDNNAKQTIINSFPYSQYKTRLTKAANIEIEKEKQAKQEEEEKSRNKSDWDSVKEGLWFAVKIFLIVFLILISLRAAGFNANANLWRPLSFRLLNFIYTFLFGIIWGPYYLIWSIKAKIDEIMKVEPEKATKPPIWYSLFPMTPFTPSPPQIDPDTGKPLPSKDEFDLNKLLFGYPDTPDVKEWIRSQCESWENLQRCALKSTVFKELQEEAKSNN